MATHGEIDWCRSPHLAPASGSELDALLDGFERGTLPKERFTHAAHLVVGSQYVWLYGSDGAMSEMRRRIRSFNEAAGGQNTETAGYHETLTRMWVLVLDRLRAEGAAHTRLGLAQLAVERYGHRRDLHRDLYSFDVVNDRRARREWVAPDLPAAAGILS